MSTNRFSAILPQLQTGASHMAMTLGSSLTFLKEFAGVAALGGALIAATGFTVSPPWATKADVENVQGSIEKVQQQQAGQIQQSQDQQCIILQLLADRYRKEQADAQDELNKNPNSATLQRARDEASTKLTQINQKLNSAPCV